MTILPDVSDPASQHRRWLHLTGSQDECLRAAMQQLAFAPDVLWVTNSPSIPLAMPAKKAHTVLGQEFQAIVFDAFSGFDVNAFAAISGTLRGGGVLVLLSPPLDEWADYPDPDYRRFLPYPYQPEQVEGRFLRRLVGMLDSVGSPPAPPQSLPRDGGQASVIAAILSATTPVVLTADRGRGKSAALGMAASALVEQGLRVLLTAPSRAAVTAVFKHAPLPPAFFAPDDLLQTLPVGDVLLVDEAAAIPIPLLLKLLQHYPRCVFSTTLHGYEGSGRGFVLRFQKALEVLAPGWQALRLQQPMRWAADDPLEQAINRWLLLDVGDGVAPVVEGAQQYQQLDRDALLADEPLLRQVFGLLVTAHYQTRPSDLRQMLDAPDLSVHVLEQGGQVTAVALLSREGGLDATLTAAIHAGQRRPHGHPVPQTLTFHAKLAGAAELVCERVMRIAVHPELQGQGLGKQLLARLVQYATERAADYIAVSYAMTPELLQFWGQAGFVLARVGQRRDAASGSCSVVQIRGLTAAGQALVGRCLSCQQAANAPNVPSSQPSRYKP